ncbi:MAG: hypothetical protein ABI946_02015 [Chthoniobacterales bacterium]
MLNFGYRFARIHGAAVRAAYAAALPYLPEPVVRNSAPLPFEVYTYSGEAALPEQIAAIRSLLRYAGQPKKITIVSDGSHPARSLELLRRLDPHLVIAQASDFVPADLPTRLHAYLTGHPTGKQLAVMMALPVNGPALYLDSDVLFFPGAHALASELFASEGPAAFLADCQLSADERMFRDPVEGANPVNAGFVFWREKLNWASSLERFLELPGDPIFFTNQTLTHLAMHENEARPLDPRKFLLQLDDQFSYGDFHKNPERIMRHYVNPVRHKFWTALCS